MNPVRLQNKSIVWILALFLLIALFLSAIIAVSTTTGTNDSCTVYKVIIFIEPIWMFLYYRLYSRLLIKIMDKLTCECAEHGVGYAIFHYAIWSTIGHPIICFGAFIILMIQEMLDIFSDKTCTVNTSLSDTQRQIWDICFIIATFISLIIVIPAAIIVSYKNHKDVKFKLNWNEQDAKQREKAISDAIQNETITFIYGQENNEQKQNEMQNHTKKGNDTDGNIENKNNNNNNNNNNNKNNDELNAANDADANAAEIAFGDVNIDEFEAKNKNNNEDNIDNTDNNNNNNIDDNIDDNINDNDCSEQSDIDAPIQFNRSDTEEQLRLAITASMVTAKEEEEKRGTTNTDGAPPLTRNISVSMSGFWAKGQAISTAYLGSMFSQSHYECIVCYEDYAVGQTIAKLKCGHQLHKKCAKEWLSQNPTCPFCRINVLRSGI